MIGRPLIRYRELWDAGIGMSKFLGCHWRRFTHQVSLIRRLRMRPGVERLRPSRHERGNGAIRGW